MNDMLQKNRYRKNGKLKSFFNLLFISLIILSSGSLIAQENALHFNGTSYIEIADQPSLRITNNMTIEAWIYLDDTENNTILDKGDYNYLFQTHPNGQPALGLYSRSFGWIYSGGTLPANQWAHVAVSFQTGTNGVKFYLNGNLLSEHTTNIPLATDNGPVNIGRQSPWSCACNLFNGTMDELRIWNVARTQSQIAENMNLKDLCEETGLAAYFPFNEISGNTVSSTIGSITGTITTATQGVRNVYGATEFVTGVSVNPPAACPTLQTLTILGGSGVQGQIDPYTEASRDGGVTWQPAYLTGWHPWGFAEGTNSWVNFDPSPFVGLYTTTDYRIRFYVPTDFYDPHMTFVIKADNRAQLSINGVFISQFDGQGSGAAGDQVIAQAITPGLNEIQIRLTDFGGWVGLNYRIDLTMFSLEELTLEPSTFSNTDPVAAAGDDQIFDCTPATGSEVTLDGSGSTDEDGDQLTYSWSNGVNTASQTLTLAPGTHTFTLTVTDGKGGSSSDDVTVTINADTDLPTIAASTQQLSLWPPNHKYETVSLSDFGISASDNCADVSPTSLVITKVTSDEAENAKGKGDGNTEDDIVIANDFQSVDLRKERAGNGNGRVYTIFVALSDGNGNVGEASFQVVVQHNKKSDAIDDGAAYEVEGGSVVLFASVENGDGNSGQTFLAKSVGSENSETSVQSLPENFELSQNYPNPFNPSTTIQVALPDAGSYRLNVYNLLGQHVASLFNGQLNAGVHSFNFDATNLSTGVYIYSLKGEQVNISKKMSLMK